jgi:hypothetical protein
MSEHRIRLDVPHRDGAISIDLDEKYHLSFQVGFGDPILIDFAVVSLTGTEVLSAGVSTSIDHAERVLRVWFERFRAAVEEHRAASRVEAARAAHAEATE